MAAKKSTYIPGDNLDPVPSSEPESEVAHASSNRSPPDSDHLPEADPDRQETVISRRRPDVLVRMDGSLDSSPVLEGETLGHFRLEKFVGGGGMGSVYRATDTMLDRTVAVKVLARDHSNEELLKRFRNEAQSGARLDHDNIARVHYVGEDKGLCYIVFEFIEGYNIRDLVARRGPLPLDEAVSYTLAVAEALEHAFRRDVVHRDIKPSNVLITPDGHVKLVDMGLARLHQVETSNQDLTASGVTLGTFDYISPEQARDPRSADVRSDIYSLGCTLYFMLTGKAPFPDGTVLQKLLSHTSDERPDPRLYRPDVPEEVITILNKMLARHPDQRYQKPSELIGELLLTADFLGLESSRGGTVWVTPHAVQLGAARRLMPVLLPVLVMVLVIVALDRFWPSSKLPKDTNFGPPLLEAAKDDQLDVNAPQREIDQVTKSKDTPRTDQIVKDPEKLPTPTDDNPRGVAPKGEDVRPPTGQQENLDDPFGLGFATGNRLGPSADLGASISADPGNISASATQSGTTVAQISAADVKPRSVPIEEPSFIVVGSPDLVVPTEAKLVDSLAAAFQFASGHPEIKDIQLWFNGPRHESPFVCSVQELIIKAGKSFEPVVVFQPPDDEATRRMMQFVGGAIEWSNIHFVFDLPKTNKRSSWSFFYLDQVQSIEMDRCTMTIRNSLPGGELRQDRVSFFDINSPAAAGMPAMMPEGQQVVNRPTIKLSGCIARGEAVLVNARAATPFTLEWTQGLFVTTRTLIESGGAAAKPDWDDRVAVHLTKVTAFMDGGLCFFRSHPDSPHHLELSINCNKCILLADPQSPLIEHVGVTNMDDVLESLTFEGMHNCFPTENIVWRISPSDGQSNVEEFTFSRADNQDWFSQKLPEHSELISWKQTPEDDKLIHEFQMSDFLLDDKDSTNPAILIKAGFDFVKLPTLPEMPAARMDAPSAEPLENALP